jgi:hypothetical protein
MAVRQGVQIVDLIASVPKKKPNKKTSDTPEQIIAWL